MLVQKLEVSNRKFYTMVKLPNENEYPIEYATWNESLVPLLKRDVVFISINIPKVFFWDDIWGSWPTLLILTDSADLLPQQGDRPCVAKNHIIRCCRATVSVRRLAVSSFKPVECEFELKVILVVQAGNDIARASSVNISHIRRRKL
jgi:hypothetical protein